MLLRLRALPTQSLLLVVLAAPAARAGDAPAAPADWTLGPGLAASRGDFTFRLTGYAQEEVRSFRDFTNERGETPELNPTDELRRSRLGFQSNWKRLEVQFQYDFADDTNHLKDAYAELTLGKPLHVRAGSFKVPVSAEFLASAAKTDFIERSAVVSELAPGRDWGVALLGDPKKFLSYEIGVFAGDGYQDPRSAGTTVAGRVVVSPVTHLDVGASYSQARMSADPEDGSVDPTAKGFPGHSPSGFTFYVHHFVNGTRRRMGADVQYTPGPVGLKLELLRGTEERKGQGSVFDDVPGEVATGWSASATWLVTGEKKKRTIEPRRSLRHGGPGAIELGVRYEALRFDDDGPDTGFAGAGNRARNIRAVEDRVLTGGLSWWPVRWVRLMGNVVGERFDDPLLAPVPGKKGTYVSLLGRVQVSVP